MQYPRLLRWLSLAIVLGAGCAGVPKPTTVNYVNAALPDDKPIFGTIVPSGGNYTVIIAEFSNRARTETVKAGNRTYEWEVDQFAVNVVEKGEWPSEVLTFLAYQPPRVDGRATPAVNPWPYLPGTYFRFWLDTSATPARIVGQQQMLLAPAQ